MDEKFENQQGSISATAKDNCSTVLKNNGKTKLQNMKD